MKKVVAFLLCVLIFVTPVTTFVKADVVIGDNDDIIINENATILGRKLALMESLSDLALSGVTEFTISNTNDVDSYLDYLWGEIDNAIESLSDGTGFQEISNNLKSKYFTNLVQYKDYITNRGNYLAHLLPSGNPTTSLLNTFFANNIYGKHYTEHYDLALDMFRSLSALNRDVPTPSPDPDFSFINDINTYNFNNNVNLIGNPLVNFYNEFQSYYLNGSYNYTFYSIYNLNNHSQAHDSLSYVINSNIITVYLNSNEDGYSASYLGVNWQNLSNIFSSNIGSWGSQNYYRLVPQYDYLYSDAAYYSNPPTLQTSFVGLSSAINYLYQHFININLFVDGVLWVQVSNPVNNLPILDIDGFLKLYGNDNPQQYKLQPNTKIDYDQLYQVIYNAIRDNLPISQNDINYYDSHDTIYSPTIINNYGEEEGDESDLIDTILDYAVIPKFDTAIAQPMRAALTNGVVIMNNSITNVIPNEILLILGACFFLLLFAVVINRMIK